MTSFLKILKCIPANILARNKPHALLADFGLAAQKHTTQGTTLLYMAPEVAATLYGCDEDKIMPSKTTDLWALGCTLFELWAGSSVLQQLHGHLLLEEDTLSFLQGIQQRDQQKIVDLIQQPGLCIPKDYHPLLRSLLQVDPRLRKIPEEFLTDRTIEAPPQA